MCEYRKMEAEDTPRTLSASASRAVEFAVPYAPELLSARLFVPRWEEFPNTQAVEDLGYRWEGEPLPVYGAVLHRLVHRNSGLRISWMALPGRVRKTAAFVVPFGASSVQFETSEGMHSLPFGVAHYLEHCMFSRGLDGGLMARFHDLGISANAYTTYSHTQFDLQTVDHFAEGVRLYAEALFEPKLDTSRVEAERQIILAERSMYEDEPESRLFLEEMRNLFSTHSLRVDICGDLTDIERISLDDLLWSTRAFYQPQRVELFLSGSFDLLEVLAALAPFLETHALQTPLESSGLLAIHDSPRMILPEEHCPPVRNESICHAPISNPQFTWGFKDPTLRGSSPLDRLRWENILQLYSSVLLGEASPCFQTLYEKGWLNDSFHWMFYQDEAIGLVLFQGESRFPREAVAAIREAWLEGILHPEQLEEDWACEQRADLGRLWMSLDSVGACNSVQIRARLMGLDAPEWLDLRSNIRPDDLKRFDYLATAPLESIVYMKKD